MNSVLLNIKKMEDFRYSRRLEEAMSISHKYLPPPAPKSDYFAYLTRLRRLNSEEYGDVMMIDDGSPENNYSDSFQQSKKFKKTHDEMREFNSQVARKLANVFEQKNKDNHKPFSPAKIKNTEAPRTYKNSDEIKSLEETLQSHRISRREFSPDQQFNIWLSNKCLERIFDEVLPEVLHDVVEEVVPEFESMGLSDEHEELVENILYGGPKNQILISKYNVDVKRQDLLCLEPQVWLNDEIINFWFQMLNDRNQELFDAKEIERKSHFFNSFFYTKVSENGYNFVNVRRWTRKFDIFAMEKIFIPVNISNTHWCLAVIFMQEKRIQYYDSMNGCGTKCLEVLLRYLKDEMKHKKKMDFDDSDWTLKGTVLSETPQQKNGSDCGVFTSFFAYYLSNKEKCSFSQKDMEYFRKVMILSTVEGEIFDV